MTEGQRLRILIVASHEIVRSGLSRMLSRRGEFEILGEAASAAEAKEMASRLQPDVVVLDTHLHDQPGVSASREIRSQKPHVQVLLLTSHSNDEAVVSTVVAGAAGYLLKEIRPGDIVHSLRRLGQGQSLLNPTVTFRVLERLRTGSQEDANTHLSATEQEILELLAQGRTDREISEALSLDEESVREHVNALWSKLEYSRRIQATYYTATWRNRILRG
ncbi:MAG: response regulator [Dehalococcoidia bacterium]